MWGMTEVRKGTRTVTSVSVGTGSAVQLAKLNTNRKSLLVQNQGAQNIFIGPSTVTISGPTTGYLVAAGTTFTDNASADELWALSSSGTQIVSVVEVS
jgi:hypothetical protein